MTRVDLGKTFRLIIALTIPTIAVCFDAGEALRLSEKPSEYIGLVFSVLAASLFATVSIVGDPGNLMRGSWRNAWEGAKGIQLRLMRLTYLFVLYLLVLALLVLSEVVEANEMISYYFIHDLFAWSAILAFIWSLWLPFEIRNIQVSRLEAEINNRKSGSE
jgi:hypothetical protein